MRASGVAVGVLVLAALFQLGAPALGPAPLIAQIEFPPSGFKLRPGEQAAARVRVEGGVQGDLTWTLAVAGAGAERVELASGIGHVDGVVAMLSAEPLVPGEKYILTLSADDGNTASVARADVQVTDAAYALIPVEEGNRWRLYPSVYGSDASGDVLFVGGPYADPMKIVMMDRPSGRREQIEVPVWNTESVRLTGDGSRLFFFGWIPPAGSALGFLDLRTRMLAALDSDDVGFLSTDSSGRRVAYWGQSGTLNGLQYFLYDEESGRRQLTDYKDVVRTRVPAGGCPNQLGTRPFISADGSRVVIITQATLGMAGPDDTVGCRVFVYDVAEEQWRHAAALPRSIIVDVPTLSGDGRWLSFRAQARLPSTQAQALLLDLNTGKLQDPVIDVGPYGTADSVVTGDAQGIVISTEADLDPRVGNADHNLELFHYDLATHEVRQISETTGGIRPTSGPCPSYRPGVSNDGGVVVFGFFVQSVELCQLDGPMRHERDGFIFRWVRAVRRRPGNRGPELDPIADQRVRAGETLALEFAALDPDGDPISFFAQVKGGDDVPPGSVMADHNDGTATLTWETRPEHAGTTVVRVAAFDEGGDEVWQDVTITVLGSERSPTPSPLPSDTPEATASVTPTAPASVCPGDCNGDGRVVINELLTATTIALGTAPLSACPAAACAPGAGVSIACLTRAVTAALAGCP
jgi:hypothetical protein